MKAHEYFIKTYYKDALYLHHKRSWIRYTTNKRSGQTAALDFYFKKIEIISMESSCFTYRVDLIHKDSGIVISTAYIKEGKSRIVA